MLICFVRPSTRVEGDEAVSEGGGAPGVVANAGQTISALCDIISRMDEYTDRSETLCLQKLVLTQITPWLNSAHPTSLTSCVVWRKSAL